MRARLPLLLGSVLMLSAVGYAAALSDGPVAVPADRAATVPAIQAAAPAPDAFLALSDITSSAPERAVCPCQQGYNCCGDHPEDGFICGPNWSCTCQKPANPNLQCRM